MSSVLDEKLVMDSDVAGEGLRRRIPPQELWESRDSLDFGVMPASLMETEIVTNPSPEFRSRDIVSKKGKLWSEKNDGMVQWSVRRQVNEDTEKKERNEEGGEEEGAGGRGEGEGEGENQRNEEENDEEIARTRKRKCYSTRQIQKGKKAKRMINEEKRIVLSYREPKVLRISTDRWSAQRYKLAEENMLMILKAKEAFVDNPILRPALRRDALKLIRDPCLLDHLLKHMAGKLAPGGNERFRRRYNEEEMIEYWLESADLINIRKEAGARDPYWVPPAGWKPGENPNICSSEIKLLKEEMAKMKRDMMELVSKKQGEGDEGMIEYWLESADLANIRKEAGVRDAYWVPPAGWKRGQNPNICSSGENPNICSSEIKLLKEEMAKMKRNMMELVSKKQGEGDLAIVTIPIYCNTNDHMVMVEDISNKQGDGDLAIVTTPIFCDTNPNMKRDEKELYHELAKRMAKLKERLVQIFHSLQKIEEEMGQLGSAIQMQRSYEKKVELIGEKEKNKETLAR